MKAKTRYLNFLKEAEYYLELGKQCIDTDHYAAPEDYNKLVIDFETQTANPAQSVPYEGICTFDVSPFHLSDHLWSESWNLYNLTQWLGADLPWFYYCNQYRLLWGKRTLILSKTAITLYEGPVLCSPIWTESLLRVYPACDKAEESEKVKAAICEARAYYRNHEPEIHQTNNGAFFVGGWVNGQPHP